MNQGVVEQHPAGKNVREKYENGKYGNQVYILSQVQVAGKYGFET